MIQRYTVAARVNRIDAAQLPTAPEDTVLHLKTFVQSDRLGQFTLRYERFYVYHSPAGLLLPAHCQGRRAEARNVVCEARRKDDTRELGITLEGSAGGSNIACKKEKNTLGITLQSYV